MEVARFIDGEGRLLYKEETNTHHIMSIGYGRGRQEYLTPFEKKFRNMGGLLVRTALRPHRELHANVGTPIKPNPNLMRDMYRAARNMEFDSQYDHFTQIATYLGGVVEKDGPNAPDASRLLENYQQQAPYLEIGRVTLARAPAA